MDVQEFKKRLLAEISNTEQVIKEYEEVTQPISPDDAIGRVSRMDAINNKSVAEAGLRNAKQKLKGLQNVFGHLGSESFGKCLKCHQDIPLARILIRPQSVLCVRCAS
mgnify:CR=1 FL=1